MTSVGRHGHGVDRAGVSLKRSDFGAGGEVPDLERVVEGTGDGVKPVGRHGHSVAGGSVPGERTEERAARGCQASGQWTKREACIWLPKPPQELPDAWRLEGEQAPEQLAAKLLLVVGENVG